MSRIYKSISIAELERRWSLARKLMAERGVDVLVMQNHNDWLGGYAKYFTDLPANHGYPRTVAFYRDDLMTIVEQGNFGGHRVLKGEDPIYRGVGEVFTTSPFVSVAYTADYDADLLADDIEKKKARKVGFVAPAAMYHGFATRLRERLRACEIVDLTDPLDRIKAVKSEEELSLLRECAAMQDRLFEKVVTIIKPGMRDIELIALARHEGELQGSEQGIYLGGSAPMGQSARFQHPHFQNRTIAEGDHFVILIENNGPGGFYTEVARTIVLGKASNHLIDAFETVREAQVQTLTNIRPGAAPRDVFAEHNKFMKARGVPEETRLYAHGQGYDLVERPLIRHDETMGLEAGMCLAVHPGYDDGTCWAVICDNYILHADRPPELIHQTPKKVFEV
jgi:Xaa-Pro aminopeptidase